MYSTFRSEVWLGRTGQARSDAQAGLDIAQEVGKQAILAICLRNCGMVALVEGDCARAVQLLMQGSEAARQLRHFHADTCAVLLGLAMLRHGQPEQARHYLKVGLGAALAKGSYLAFLYGLPPVAAFLLEEGQVERAVELYALALQQPFVASSRWYEDVIGRQIAAAAERLPPQVVAAAQERGRARDLETTVGELVAELGGRG